MRTAEVYIQNRKAGTLEERDNAYLFTYSPDYLALPDAVAISLAMPLQSEPFKDKRLFPFFDGLIPEGWMLAIAETTWKLNPRDRMGLLLACCRDCIGAVSIVPEGEVIARVEVFGINKPAAATIGTETIETLLVPGHPPILCLSCVGIPPKSMISPESRKA